LERKEKNLRALTTNMVSKDPVNDITKPATKVYAVHSNPTRQ